MAPLIGGDSDSHLFGTSMPGAGAIHLISFESQFRNSCCPCDAAREQHDGSCVEKAPGGGDGGLEVLCKPVIATNPREETFNHPSAWQQDEADLPRALGNDFNNDTGRGGDPIAGIAAISEDASQLLQNIGRRGNAIL